MINEQKQVAIDAGTIETLQMLKQPEMLDVPISAFAKLSHLLNLQEGGQGEPKNS